MCRVLQTGKCFMYCIYGDIRTCILILSKSFGGLVRSLNKDEDENIGRTRALPYIYPSHSLVQAGEESQETPQKEEPTVTNVKMPFSLLAVTKLRGSK